MGLKKQTIDSLGLRVYSVCWTHCCYRHPTGTIRLPIARLARGNQRFIEPKRKDGAIICSRTHVITEIVAGGDVSRLVMWHLTRRLARSTNIVRQTRQIRAKWVYLGGMGQTLGHNTRELYKTIWNCKKHFQALSLLGHVRDWCLDTVLYWR